MSDSTDTSLWSSLSTVSTTDLISSAYTTLSDRTPSSNLDKDAFLQLLIAQMQNQDPLEPMNNQDFLAQMAQFTALEQMNNLNATFSKSQAYAMIGKTVYANYTDETTGEYNEVTGLVSAVTTKNGEAYLYVEGKDVPLSAVSLVGDDYFTAQQLDAIYSSVSNARDTNLIGKHIQALLVDDDGKVTDYVEGIVDYVKFNGSQSVLMIGNKEVFPNEVASVSDKPLLIGRTIVVPMDEENEAGEMETTQKEMKILNVTISDNKAYLEVDGASIPIEKINYIMEALDYVGQEIDFNAYQGTVNSVTVKNSMPYFNIGDQQLSYAEFKDL